MISIVTLEIKTTERVSNKDLLSHVKTAIERWGGAGHPEDQFFPGKISVVSRACARKENCRADSDK